MSVDAILRIERIRTRIQTEGSIRVVELAEEFDVSEMTIRRDLDALSEAGVVRRVHGGAVAVGPMPFSERFGRQAQAKSRIADKLVGLVSDGGAIGLDASTTIQRLATRLGTVRDLTVITNGPETFAALQNHPGVTALLTGGQLDPRTGTFVGPLAARAAREVLLRRLFTSAGGIDPVHGTSEATLEEGDTKLALADVAAQVIVAVDSAKLGQRLSARCLPIERIDVLVTELDPGNGALDPYRDRCEIL